ncbi:hypothetical protein NMY22_g18596 [Coprinellus aureogranulatus]|nr:hypothetical protein NMY22_g18596 [Coprinellus aureogranulatus]
MPPVFRLSTSLPISLPLDYQSQDGALAEAKMDSLLLESLDPLGHAPSKEPPARHNDPMAKPPRLSSPASISSHPILTGGAAVYPFRRHNVPSRDTPCLSSLPEDTVYYNQDHNGTVRLPSFKLSPPRFLRVRRPSPCDFETEYGRAVHPLNPSSWTNTFFSKPRRETQGRLAAIHRRVSALFPPLPLDSLPDSNQVSVPAYASAGLSFGPRHNRQNARTAVVLHIGPTLMCSLNALSSASTLHPPSVGVAFD